MSRRLALGALAVLAVACESDRRFESICQLVRREVVEVDERGAPLVMDVELEWDPCPGDQFQVVRGGAEFARCMARYNVGDLLPVHVVHFWDDRGYYRWDVYRVGECQRTVERHAEGSFEKSQECHETKAYGTNNGFHCSRRPFRELVSVCPWMARH